MSVFRHLRWQIALALGGLLVIAVMLAVVSDRTFEDRPAQGGQLVEGVVGAAATLNPLLATSDVELDLANLLFSGLTRIGPDGRIAPDLATRWTISPDGRTYTFTLREDVVWHDGHPFDAEDVLVTAWLAKDGGEALGAALNPLASAWALADVRAVDARVVEIELEEPYAPFLDATTMGMVPAHIFADIPPADIPRHAASTRRPIGTGPWQLEQPGAITGDELRLTRFDDHWEALGTRPYLDHLIFRSFGTREEGLAALGRREIQTMGDVPAEMLSRLGEDAAEFNAVTADYTLVFLNPSKQLFTERSVREALALALDRQGIIDELLDGQGVVADTPIPPGPWRASDLGAPTFDPDEASQILQEAGWVDSDDDGVLDRDGRPLRFVLESYNEPVSLRVAQRARDDWSRIGVAVDVRPQSQANMVRALTERAYEAALFGVAARFGHAPDPFPLWHSSQAASGQNFANLQNEAIDETLVALRSIPPNDDAARREAYARFQEEFVQQLPALMLYHPVYTYVKVDPGLGGIQLPALLAQPADRFMTVRSWFARTERIFLTDADDVRRTVGRPVRGGSAPR